MTSVEITFEDDPFEITVRVEHPLTEHALDKAEDLLHALAGVDDEQVEERLRGIVRTEIAPSRGWPLRPDGKVRTRDVRGTSEQDDERLSAHIFSDEQAHASGCPANLPVVMGMAHACTCHDEQDEATS